MKKDTGGRPQTNETRKQINVYFSQDIYETLKAMADTDKRSLSNMIEVLVEKQLESEKANV